jgi:hypothetical protein
MPRSHQELESALAIQRRHLAVSCKAFDEGDVSEALRLSTIVYTLVHDGGDIRSILSQLDLKEKLEFFASNMEISSAIRAQADRCTPLVELETKVGIPRFVPLCTFVKNRGAYFGVRKLPFDAWWNKDIIFFDGERNLTRRQLAFTLRNQEGGSHYDVEVRNPNYPALKAPSVFFVPGRGLGQMEHLELVSMRQVAEELALTLGAHFDDMSDVVIKDIDDLLKEQK